MYFTVETMRLGEDWPQVTILVLKDMLIILYSANPDPGYSSKLLLNSNFSDYNCFIV